MVISIFWLISGTSLTVFIFGSGNVLYNGYFEFYLINYYFIGIGIFIALIILAYSVAYLLLLMNIKLFQINYRIISKKLGWSIIISISHYCFCWLFSFLFGAEIATDDPLFVKIILLFTLSFILFSIISLILFNVDKKVKNSSIISDEINISLQSKSSLTEMDKKIFDQSESKHLSEDTIIFRKKRKKKQDNTITTPSHDIQPIPEQCPLCHQKLSSSGICSECKRKFCPICLNYLPIDTMICECGHSFPLTTSHKIEIHSIKPELQIMNDSKENIFLMNENTQDIVNDELQPIPKICPVCHVIGWKNDICQCGYDYILRKFPLKKIDSEK